MNNVKILWVCVCWFFFLLSIFFVVMCQNQGMIFLIYLGVDAFFYMLFLDSDRHNYFSWFILPHSYHISTVFRFLAVQCMWEEKNTRTYSETEEDHICVSKNTDNLHFFDIKKKKRYTKRQLELRYAATFSLWKAGFIFHLNQKKRNNMQ